MTMTSVDHINPIKVVSIRRLPHKSLRVFMRPPLLKSLSGDTVVTPHQGVCVKEYLLHSRVGIEFGLHTMGFDIMVDRGKY